MGGIKVNRSKPNLIIWIGASALIAWALFFLASWVSAESWVGTATAAQGVSVDIGTAVPGQQTDSAPAQGSDGTIGATTAITANCRYGVAGDEPWISAPVVATLGIGWLIYAPESSANAVPGASLLRIIYVYQNKDGNNNYLNTFTVQPALDAWLTNLIASHPGEVWFVGNEVDRGTDPGSNIGGQGDTYPDVYARAYHDVYQFIKAADPTAQVGNAGLVEATPGRMQYLDLAWNSYQATYGSVMPVDVWNMHLYIMPEANHDGTPNNVANIALGTNPALAKRESWNDLTFCSDPLYYCYKQHDDIAKLGEQVMWMRTWMKNHGQQNKPLMITEYSILYPYIVPSPVNGFNCWIVDEDRLCFSPARVSQYVANSFNYFNTAQDPNLGYARDNNRLVQSWLWFDLNFGNGNPWVPGYISNLVADGGINNLTQVGTAFQNAGAALPQSINLFVTQTSVQSYTPNGNSVTLAIKVGAMNNGNIAPSGPVQVTVYADAARTQPLGSGWFSAGMPGCARREMLTTFNITIPSPSGTGSGNYWAVVDSPNESDNVIMGSYEFAFKSMFLPLIRR